jgi:hypothetical protein
MQLADQDAPTTQRRLALKRSLAALNLFPARLGRAAFLAAIKPSGFGGLQFQMAEKVAAQEACEADLQTQRNGSLVLQAW